MATNNLLSDREKLFVFHGIEQNIRCDGRMRFDYRPMELETDITPNSNGSARLRLANSDVITSVKAEIDVPYVNRPNEGKIEFFVDCSANANPNFEGRGGKEIALEISNVLSKSIVSPKAFNLEQLCISEGNHCWKLCVDVLILECGGNLYDAVSIAVKAALFNTKLPRVTSVAMDKGLSELVLSDDIYNFNQLNVEKVPLFVTLCKIGENSIIDATPDEEACSVASLVVGVSCLNEKEGIIVMVINNEAGSLFEKKIHHMLSIATKAALHLNKMLLDILNNELNENSDENKNGFLS